jgi:hypothetical protein
MAKPDITTRFLACADHLISQGRVRSRRDFAIAIGYHPQGMSELGKGKRAVPLEVLTRAVEHFRLNPAYVLLGEGDILEEKKAEADFQLRNLSIVTDQNGLERIVHVPFPAQAGYGRLCDDPEYIGELPTYTLPDPQFRSGTYRSFEIAGPSMEPTFRPGDMVIAAFVEPRYWEQAIRDNQVFILVTMQDVLIKRIHNRLRTDRMLECISDNQEFELFTIHVEDIREVWKARMRITPYLDAPSADKSDAISRQLMEQQELLKELKALLPATAES